jgi:hypothetical protein
MMRQMFSIKPMKKALHPFLLLASACARDIDAMF